MRKRKREKKKETEAAKRIRRGGEGRGGEGRGGEGRERERGAKWRMGRHVENVSQ